MPSDYTPQTWHNSPVRDTPISAERLAHIEDGIQSHAHGDTIASVAAVATDLASETARATGVEAVKASIGDGASAGAAATNALLKAWAESESYELTAITRDIDEVVVTATVKWPDGSGGTFTTVTKNVTWLVVDAYTISHTLSGKTITQAAVTRDSAGAIITKPALAVA
jgi:hypothetical protein